MIKRFFYQSTYLKDDSQVRSIKSRTRAQIMGAYNSRIIRWYCKLRFHIINIDFLDTLEQHLTRNARVLDIGCGFGLFSIYYAASGRQRTITGFDLSQKRVAEANAVSEKLGISNVHFFCQDAANFSFSEQYDAVITLDLLHHVAPVTADGLIRRAYDALNPGGVLLIKEVNTRPFHKLYFTYFLDKLMTPSFPVHYRSTLGWKEAILKVGFEQVLAYPLNDYLPYPHILLVARKATGYHGT